MDGSSRGSGYTQGDPNYLNRPEQQYGRQNVGEAPYQQPRNVNLAAPYPSYQPVGYVPQQPFVGAALTPGQSVTPPQAPSQVSGDGVSLVPAAGPRPSTVGKKSRLKRACDSCSNRKVKCDAGDPPCSQCRKHGVECTNNREVRTRGPQNRSIQQLRAQQANSSQQPPPQPPQQPQQRPPQQPPQIATGDIDSSPAATMSLSPMTTAESGVHLGHICPLPVLKLLITDFFTYIHPLAPLPHEPTFMAAFNNPEKHGQRPLVAVTASMVGVLVASFPRRVLLHLRAHGIEHIFVRSVNFVDRCHQIAGIARGSAYLDDKPTVFTGITSYFLGLAAAYTHQWDRSRLYFAESLNISRVVCAQYNDDPSTGSPVVPVDHVMEQLSRRLFWVLFIGVRSLEQLATNYDLIIPPHTHSYQYPPYPTEVDDEYILQDRILSQPIGYISRLTAYIAGLKVYNCISIISTWNYTYGNNALFDWGYQKKILAYSIERIKEIINHLPDELRLSPGCKPGQFEPFEQTYFRDHPYTSAPANGDDEDAGSAERRALQFEIQKANLYASQLGTRSYVVEMYSAMQEKVVPANHVPADDDDEDEEDDDAHLVAQDATDEKIATEREKIVVDLLFALRSMSRINMEPSSESFVNSPSIASSSGSLLDLEPDFASASMGDEAIYPTQAAVPFGQVPGTAAANSSPLQYNPFVDEAIYYYAPQFNELRALHEFEEPLFPGQAVFLTKHLLQINKIRQVASTLLSSPQIRKGDIARRADEYLQRFLELIMQLEHVGTIDGGGDDDTDLKQWANLRDYQLQFAEAGGDLLQ